MAYIVQNTIVTKQKSFSAGDELSAEDVKIIGNDLEYFIELGAITEVGTKKENKDTETLPIEELKAKADELGIEYAQNIGAKKLAAKIAEVEEANK